MFDPTLVFHVGLYVCSVVGFHIGFHAGSHVGFHIGFHVLFLLVSIVGPMLDPMLGFILDYTSVSCWFPHWVPCFFFLFAIT